MYRIVFGRRGRLITGSPRWIRAYAAPSGIGLVFASRDREDSGRQCEPSQFTARRSRLHHLYGRPGRPSSSALGPLIRARCHRGPKVHLVVAWIPGRVAEIQDLGEPGRTRRCTSHFCLPLLLAHARFAGSGTRGTSSSGPPNMMFPTCVAECKYGFEGASAAVPNCSVSDRPSPCARPIVFLATCRPEFVSARSTATQTSAVELRCRAVHSPAIEDSPGRPCCYLDTPRRKVRRRMPH